MLTDGGPAATFARPGPAPRAVTTGRTEQTMATIAVDTEAIRNVAQRVRMGADDAESQRVSLLAQIQGLQGDWQGSASEALQDLYQRWDQQAQAINDTLTEIAVQMTQAADDYDAGEDRVGGRFRR